MSKRREQPDKGRAPLQSPPPAWQRRVEPWLPALLAVLGLVVYSTGLWGPFVFDDVAAITRNSRVQELWTVLIHVAAGLTLYGLARRTLLMPRLADRYRDSAPWLALAIAALWMVHPLTTEAVTYVVHRGESMAGLCALLVLYCAARGATSPARCWFWYPGAIAAGWIGFGCKEVMIVVPLVLLIYDRVFLAPSWSELAWHRGVLYAALLPPILWLGWLYSPDLQQWVRSKMARPAAVAQAPAPHATTPLKVPGATPQKTGAPTQTPSQARPSLSERPADDGDHKATRWEYFRSQPGVVLHYLRLAVWPDGLCVDYGWPVAKSA
ncbi:MAG: hypothetical protein K8T25_16020, partial [Planctomycetia bacterium]|nr:hypothetical protein [Planctomycetia bacterium]